MIKDKILIGAKIGLLADAVKLTFNYILFSFGFSKVLFWQIVATRFLKKEYLNDKLAYLIGAIADITVTSLLGVIFVYVIYFFSSRNIWIKGVGFGLVVWTGLFGTLLDQTVEEKLPQDPLGIIVTIIAHFAFGLALAYFTKVLIVDKQVNRT